MVTRYDRSLQSVDAIVDATIILEYSYLPDFVLHKMVYLYLHNTHFLVT